MTHEMQWKCLSAGNARTFIKLSAIMLVVGVGMDGYLLLAHGADTFEGYIRLFFLAFWSSIIGIASFALATVWLLRRHQWCERPYSVSPVQ